MEAFGKSGWGAQARWGVGKMGKGGFFGGNASGELGWGGCSCS